MATIEGFHCSVSSHSKGSRCSSNTFTLPAITDVGKGSLSGEGGSVCGSDVGDVVGAAA